MAPRPPRAVAGIALGGGERLLVLPDVHHKWGRAEAVIAAERPDATLFLGDYFDDRGDAAADARATAGWLRASVEDGSRTHLLGNHDIHYMSGNAALRCSGYGADKHAAVSGAGIDWAALGLHCAVESGGREWLCTHAGLSGRFLGALGARRTAAGVREALGAMGRDLEDLGDEGRRRPFLEAGRARGGPAPCGGPVWCDYAEFEDVPGVRQIFGHTRGAAVRHASPGDGSEHYCMDTALNHYAVVSGGAVRVRQVAA